MTPLQKRRRDVLVMLGGAAVATLLIALVGGAKAFWLLQLLADALLGSYLYLLVRLRQHGGARRHAIGAWPPATRTQPSLRHPDPPPRPELAPVPELALRRTASR